MTRFLLFAALAAVLCASGALAQVLPAPGERPTVMGEPMYTLVYRAPVIAVCVVIEGNDVSPAEPAPEAEETTAKRPLRPTASCKVVRSLAGVEEGETITVSVIKMTGRALSIVLKKDEEWLLFMRAQQQGRYPVVRAAKVVADNVTGFKVEKSDDGPVITDGEMPMEEAIAAVTKAIADHVAAAEYDVSPEAKTDAQLLADIGDNEELNLKIVRALGIRKACPQLLTLLQGLTPGSRLHLTVMGALGQCPGDATEDVLIGLLKSNNRAVSNSAAQSLATLGSKRALQPLLEIARAETGILSYNIARALAATGDPQAIEPLLEARRRIMAAADDGEPGPGTQPWLRVIYFRLLGEFDDPRVLEVASEELKSADRAAVLVAADILHSHGDPAGVKRLVALLEEDSSYGNQSSIIVKLRDMKAIDAAPAIIKLLQSQNVRLRALAANALRQMTAGEDGCAGCGEDAAKWQEWWDKREGG